VGGVVEEGVAEAALVDEDDAEAGALGVDGAGQAGGAGADDAIEGVKTGAMVEWWKKMVEWWKDAEFEYQE
jgi:hypothetical protein